MDFLRNGPKKRVAEFISNITYAPLLSIPVFALISYYLLKGQDFILLTTVSILFAGVFPTLIVLLWIRNKNIKMDIPERKERNYPLIMVIISYLIGVIVLYALNAPYTITVLMFCYFSNTLILFFINLFWKISIHAMGVAGPTVALIYVFGYMGAVFGFILPLVMWSRVYLHKHTVSQVTMGALLGFLLTAVQISIL
jgi:membrane-associated phospholipid phosphatase